MVFWVSSVAPALPTKGTQAPLSTIWMCLRLKFRMVRKASSISPHILCNSKVINVIGIQDYFIAHEAIADNFLYLISKLLPLGIVPPDCSTPAKKARREGEKDVSSR